MRIKHACDGENRPISVTTSSDTVTYLFGPDGSRLKKITNTGITTYLSDNAELDEAGGWTFHRSVLQKWYPQNWLCEFINSHARNNCG